MNHHHHHHYHQIHRRLRGVRLTAHDAFPPGTFTPMEVIAGYGFAQGSFKVPTPVKIGVLSLGGSYVSSDLQAACTAWGIPMPTVTAITAGGAKQDPTDQDSNVENALDLQCIAGAYDSLTKTPANITICFGPNATGGMLAALNALVAEGCNVISISWGGPDSSWSAQERAGLAAGFAAAAAKGVTVCAASGDNSIDDGTGSPVADYPCSDPNVWAVGGTNLVLNVNGLYKSESAWGDGQPGDEGGGGGFDASVSTPTWQVGVVPAGQGRGVPDSSANADPNSGYQICANGSFTVVGGTSASTPITASILAAAKAVDAQAAGLVSAMLYAARATAFRDITTGSNGSPATVGWDKATGNGSPNGVAFSGALGKAPAPPAPVPPPSAPPAPPAPSGPAGLTLAQAQQFAAQGAVQALAAHWPVGAK
jgi:kumamolisin